MRYIPTKKSVRDRLYYLSLVCELYFWQHSHSAVTGLPVLDYLIFIGMLRRVFRLKKFGESCTNRSLSVVTFFVLLLLHQCISIHL